MPGRAIRHLDARPLADIRRQMGTPLNVHRALASYPAWLRAWFPFRNHVVHGTSLSSRQYELAVLRVATLTDAAYEWEHHVVTAMEASTISPPMAAKAPAMVPPPW